MVLPMRMNGRYVLRGEKGCERWRRLIDNLDIGGSGLSGLLGVLPLEDSTAILVQLETGDNDIAGVNADGGAGAVGLVPGDTVDMDDPLLPVDLDNLSLTTLVLPPDNADLVVLANGDGTSVVLGAEFSREGRGHDLSADRGGGREVRLARLAPRGRNVGVVLHFWRRGS